MKMPETETDPPSMRKTPLTSTPSRVSASRMRPLAASIFLRLTLPSSAALMKIVFESLLHIGRGPRAARGAA